MKKTKTNFEQKLVSSDNTGTNILVRVKKDKQNWARPEYTGIYFFLISDHLYQILVFRGEN